MKKSSVRLALALSLSVVFSEPVFGTGNDNPTGVTGQYNGSITTAGSYDPYTGNATRTIADLTVTGAVGAYPLKWSRTLKPFPPGVVVRERIAWSNAVSFNAKGVTIAEFPTDRHGAVRDPWVLPFNNANGQVNTHQTIFANGLKGTSESVVHADGRIEGQGYIPLY